MLNSVVIIGRLTRDPEIRHTTSGTAVCNFTLAVDRRKKEDGCDFIDCVAWQKTAELVSQYLGKGRQCAVNGRLQVRSYEVDGNKRKAVEVVAESVVFLGGAKEASSEPRQEEVFNEDDIPF